MHMVKKKTKVECESVWGAGKNQECIGVG